MPFHLSANPFPRDPAPDPTPMHFVEDGHEIAANAPPPVMLGVPAAWIDQAVPVAEAICGANTVAVDVAAPTTATLSLMAMSPP